MSVQYIHKKALGTETTPTVILDSTSGRALIQNRSRAAGIAYDRATDEFKYNGADAIGTLRNGVVKSEVVITTRAVLASESGRTFYLTLAAGFVTTLPAPALGLQYRFVVATAPTGSYTVICAASGTLIKGHVLTNDLNSGTDSDFGTAGELTLTFVLNKAVAGDWADFESDGTNWFVRAGCSVFDAITIS